MVIAGVDPNASVLHVDDVDLDSADFEGDRIRLVRPAALGPAILVLDDVTLVGDVKRIDGHLWFMTDREATWRHT